MPTQERQRKKRTNIWRTKEQKALLLAEAEIRNVWAVARENRIAPSLFYRWRKQQRHILGITKQD